RHGRLVPERRTRCGGAARLRPGAQTRRGAWRRARQQAVLPARARRPVRLPLPGRRARASRNPRRTGRGRAAGPTRRARGEHRFVRRGRASGTRQPFRRRPARGGRIRYALALPARGFALARAARRGALVAARTPPRHARGTCSSGRLARPDRRRGLHGTASRRPADRGIRRARPPARFATFVLRAVLGFRRKRHGRRPTPPRRPCLHCPLPGQRANPSGSPMILRLLPRLVLPAALAAFVAAPGAQPLRPAPAASATGSPASKAPVVTTTSPAVVTVGGTAIRKDRVDTLATLMARARGAELDDLPAEQVMQLRRMVTTNLIGQELLELEAKARG